MKFNPGAAKWEVEKLILGSAASQISWVEHNVLSLIQAPR